MLTGRLCGATSREARARRAWMVPASGCSKPAIIRSVVVLPQPGRARAARRTRRRRSRGRGRRPPPRRRTSSPGPVSETAPVIERPSSVAPAVSRRGQVAAVGDEAVDVRRRCAAPRSATARPCPTAAGTRRGCAARASAPGRSGRRARGSRGSCVIGSGRNETQPLAPAVTTCHGRSCRSMTSWSPVAIRSRSRSRWAYAAGVSTSVSIARAAAIAERVAVERADLLVACRRRSAPSPRSVPPIAAVETPPPIALARQTRSGVTPSSRVTPPGPAVRPVFTSSKVSSAPCRAAGPCSPAR